MAQQTTDRRGALREDFATGEPSDLQVEILEELREIARAGPTPPATLSALAVQDVKQAEEARREMMMASIRMTQPEDWVVFATQDGAQVAYLQDVGCQRVRSLWGISVDKMNPAQDFLEDQLDDGHVQFMASVSGVCQLTGEQSSEIGARSSLGFFEKQWADAVDSPGLRGKLRVDIRKAAKANAEGRLIRRFTGLNAVPVELLVAAGLKRERMRGATFQSGSRGGAGSYATDKQVWKIADEAMKKVKGLGDLTNMDALQDRIRAATLSGGRGGEASSLIERLMSQKPRSVSVEEFEKVLGVSVHPVGNGDGDAPPQEGDGGPAGW